MPDAFHNIAAAFILSSALAFGAAFPALGADDSYDLHVIIPLTGGGAFLGRRTKIACEAAAPRTAACSSSWKVPARTRCRPVAARAGVAGSSG